MFNLMPNYTDNTLLNGVMYYTTTLNSDMIKLHFNRHFYSSIMTVIQIFIQAFVGKFDSHAVFWHQNGNLCITINWNRLFGLVFC